MRRAPAGVRSPSRSSLSQAYGHPVLRGLRHGRLQRLVAPVHACWVPSTTWIGIFTWSTILTKSGIDRGVVASALSSRQSPRPVRTFGRRHDWCDARFGRFGDGQLLGAHPLVCDQTGLLRGDPFGCPYLRGDPSDGRWSSLTAFPVSPYSTPAGALAVPRAASVITVPVCVE